MGALWRATGWQQNKTLKESFSNEGGFAPQGTFGNVGVIFGCYNWGDTTDH